MKDNIPSTAAPNKVWSLSFLKNPGRPGYWSAVEGTIEQHQDSEGRAYSTFSFELFGSRRVRGESIPGVATEKKREAARTALVAELRARNLIVEAQP